MSEHIRGKQGVGTDFQTAIDIAKEKQRRTQRGFRMDLGALSKLVRCGRITFRHV